MPRAIDFYIEKIPDFEEMDYEQRRYWIEYECLESEKRHSKATLKHIFRVKPKIDARPVGGYEDQYGNWIDLYHFSQCEPMKAKSSKPRTAKQKVASKNLAVNSMLQSKLAKAGKAAYELLEKDPLFLDTETTGLDSEDQVLEIGVCDQYGNSIFDQRIKPTVMIAEGAERVHGISAEDLKDAPTFADIYDELKDIIQDKKIIIFNESFDFRLLAQTCEAFKLDTDWLYNLDTSCAMRLSARAYSATNRYGSISLANSVYAAEVEYNDAHSAIGDARMTAKVVKAIAKTYTDLLQELCHCPSIADT